MTTEEILKQAEKLVTKDRQDIYGHPYVDFGRVAKLTEAIRESTLIEELKHALYMIQVKVARLLETPDHEDSIVDLIGYALTYHMIVVELKRRGVPMRQLPDIERIAKERFYRMEAR